MRIDLSALERHPPIVETAHPITARRTVLWHNERDTSSFATRLSACPAVRNAFIELLAELSAGKASLVRHLLRALGVHGRIKSPTYAVVEPHDADGLSVWHFDFYRFDDPREWEEAGFRDLFASSVLKLAEWPEKAAGVLPVADLVLRIDTQSDETRIVACEARTPTGQALLSGVAP